MRLAIGFAALFASACGASIPRRCVVERDVDDEYRYRRYQKVLDVEVPVADNAAVGHTAVYEGTEETEGPPLAVAFVARYEKAPGLAMELHRAVEKLEGYEVGVREVAGGNAWVLRGEQGDLWALWASGRYIVKVGTPAGRTLPEAVLDLYMDIYPSDLEGDGTPAAGAASAGDPSPEAESSDGTPIPNFLP